VLTLTLNRPQKRNALSVALRTALFSALAAAESDDEIDVVVLTGADPVFCAGLDLNELDDSDQLQYVAPQWPTMSKPVIGAINGAAVTGGLELALYCDILIASERASFADTHARVGLVPTWGLSVRLPQKVGVGMARRMSLTGRYLPAAEALRAGLVTEVVPYDQLLAVADDIAMPSSTTTKPECALCWISNSASTRPRWTPVCGPRHKTPSNGYARPGATTSPSTAKRSFVVAPTQTTT
jgi:enoyl-CoA hydratase